MKIYIFKSPLLTSDHTHLGLIVCDLRHRTGRWICSVAQVELNVYFPRILRKTPVQMRNPFEDVSIFFMGDVLFILREIWAYTSSSERLSLSSFVLWKIVCFTPTVKGSTALSSVYLQHDVTRQFLHCYELATLRKLSKEIIHFAVSKTNFLVPVYLENGLMMTMMMMLLLLLMLLLMFTARTYHTTSSLSPSL